MLTAVSLQSARAAGMVRMECACALGVPRSSQMRERACPLLPRCVRMVCARRETTFCASVRSTEAPCHDLRCFGCPRHMY